MNNDLIPPNQNSMVLGAAHAVLPAFLAWQKLQVIPSANCVNSLRLLRGTQTVIALNHADRFDPETAFALSKICGEDFYYMAARELFDQKFFGWFMQNCGAYSVVRGVPEDVPSKQLTIELIAQGSRKLVEFPEGDVTGRDDAILPLKEDGLRNIIEAQGLTKRESPIHVLPTSSPILIPDVFNLHPSQNAIEFLDSRIRAEMLRALQVMQSKSRNDQAVSV